MPRSPSSLRKDFLLDPDIIFLNHGSFGACPRPVYDAQIRWQRRLEREPVLMLGREIDVLMAEARAALGAFLNVSENDVVFFPNPTTALNVVARNLMRRDAPFCLGPGDEIITTDHEYGAMDRTWRYVCSQTGARYVQVPIPLPVEKQSVFVERVWRRVTPRTKALFISHITSPTALIFPIQTLCQRAREAGILCIVDGAHAPGQIPLNLKALEADIYAGALHKWLMAPKGSAFLYARPEIQTWLDPLVISWGYEAEQAGNSRFIDYHEWQGTRDMAPFLSVPAAIRYQQENDWEQVRRRSHDLAVATRARINALTGHPDIAPPNWLGQMASLLLPAHIDPEALQQRLWQKYRIEIPAFRWKDHALLRISFQGYNGEADADALVDALDTELHAIG